MRFRLLRPEPSRRFSPGALAAAIVVNVAMAALLVVGLVRPAYVIGIFEREDASRIPIERIGFISLPNTGAEETPGRAGGDGRPETTDAVAPPIVAPAGVPEGLPPAGQGPETGGTGPVIGAGGALRGIRPSYSDPRVWTRPDRIVSLPRLPSGPARVEASIREGIARHLDSLAAAGTPRDPTDWTFERDGKKWGIDRDYIRLGDVSIPTTVLALLPLNVRGNPTEIDRERGLAARRTDIDFHAQRAMNEDDFRQAVRRINARKERERAEAAAVAERERIVNQPRSDEQR